MSDEDKAVEKPKKVIRRKPLWLLIPVGERTIRRGDAPAVVEKLYSVEQFTSLPDLRKNLEARELDQTNAKGILLFRTDAIPVEAKMRAQIVIKFNGSDEEGAPASGDEEEEGVV